MTKQSPKQAPGIIGAAVLVDLTMGVWGGRKKDKKVTDEVNAAHGTEGEAVSVWKQLLTGGGKGRNKKAPELNAVLAATRALYRFHVMNTLPWEEGGYRLLPTANSDTYADGIRRGIAAVQSAVADLDGALPRLINADRKRLNDLWNKKDYPVTLSGKFKVQIDYAPVPVTGDFRVDTLPAAVKKEMERNLEERTDKLIRAAVSDAWTRLGDAVKHFRDRTKEGTRLHDSMVEQLRTVADILTRLNVTNDVELEALRSQVLRDLAPVDLVALRKDKDAREEAVAKADAILKQMKDFYNPSPNKEGA